MANFITSFPARVESKLRRIHLVKLAQDMLSGGPKPVYLDIGARGGLPWHWGELLRLDVMDAAAIELDPVECKRLKIQFPKLVCLPYALADTAGIRPLYITRISGCTSFLKPNLEVLADFQVKDWFDIMRVVDLETLPYRDLVARGEAPTPTYIKLDVQGFEREVLKGFGDILRDTVAIEMEGHFRPIYQGQWTAGEMITEMRELGFSLRKITQQGPFEGEFLEGNFYFSRLSPHLSPTQAPALKLWEYIEEIAPPVPYEPVPDAAPTTAIESPPPSR